MVAFALMLTGVVATGRSSGSELRRTPVVVAVENARTSVVNIFGEKPADTQEERPVKGMGTGIVVDRRGYIVTNFHVVDGVSEINVTLAEGDTLAAELVSSDSLSDLAVIKINARRPLKEITIGTSRDLMTGESVIAVGNAYGYGHTVTRGIISSLHRTVQISDTQSYRDLIQTDASINPGNSGGPLLNIDGEMVGLNVAVRAGAQGIGFAIPVDQVMDTIADLMNTQVTTHTRHGVETAEGEPGQEGIVVKSVATGSPAGTMDLKPGDRLTTVGGSRIHHRLDFERALLDYRPGDSVSVGVVRGGAPLSLSITLAKADQNVDATARAIWDMFGMKLRTVPSDRFQRFHSQYSGGLEVTDVRAESPASRQRIRRGDILVGMHVWETTTLENVSYILSNSDVVGRDAVKFYILRGGDTLFGYLPVSGSVRR
ncbi:MAG: trypsin-like peptidase domain-containing protein [Pirellulales bacterium]|nr:trypsin-like peptidase domain-containing protein [Planctomycetales bacterium]